VAIQRIVTAAVVLPVSGFLSTIYFIIKTIFLYNNHCMHFYSALFIDGVFRKNICGLDMGCDA
jgi:hypothetical protein